MKVGLIWQTNVWKSTIFNKLIKTHRAIVTEIAWTTRQIISEHFYPEDDFLSEIFDSPWLEDFDEEIVHIEEIIQSCDIILFILDWKNWLNSKDEKIKELILKSWKQNSTILIINKLDWKVWTRNEFELISEYYSFWFKNIIWSSWKNWEWIEEIKNQIMLMKEKLNLKASKKQEETYIPISFVWRPNSWKSTLINKFAQDDISIVKDTMWTTLDYIQAKIKYKWKDYMLYDTAWIRKRWKIHWLEKIAFDKTTKLIEYKKPVCIILIDIYDWITHTDKTIIAQIEKLNVPIIIALNKSDMLDRKTLWVVSKQITRILSFWKHIPIIEISAKEWMNLDKILKFADMINNEYWKEVSTSKLNSIMQKAWMANPPRFPKNKVCKFYYMTQTWIAPAKFLVFINKKKNLNFAFEKRIINNIRKNFWYIWCPIILEFKEKNEEDNKK